MHRTSSILGAVLLGLGLATTAVAQPGSHANPTPARSSHAKASEVPTIAVRGQIVGPEGPLPGAIVTLKSGAHSAVTNSNGMFLLSVPAGAPMPAIVSFAGFEDEEITIDPNTQDATLRLTTAHPIKVKRKQSLKTYMKTARKQARRESRALK
jgi:hypothetical protein